MLNTKERYLKLYLLVLLLPFLKSDPGSKDPSVLQMHSISDHGLNHPSPSYRHVSVCHQYNKQWNSVLTNTITNNVFFSIDVPTQAVHKPSLSSII